jgi:hypothetical protein
MIRAARHPRGRGDSQCVPQAGEAHLACGQYTHIVKNESMLKLVHGFVLGSGALGALLIVTGLVVQYMFNEPNPMFESGVRVGASSLLLGSFLWLVNQQAKRG